MHQGNAVTLFCFSYLLDQCVFWFIFFLGTSVHQPALLKTDSACPAVMSPQSTTNAVTSPSGPPQTFTSTAPWRVTGASTPPALSSSASEPSTHPCAVLSLPAPNITPFPADPKVQHEATLNDAPTLAWSVPPLPKLNSPINVVPSITQIQSVTQRSYSAPPAVEQTISPVPTYVPVATAQVAPTQISPVVLASSISPTGEGADSPTAETPLRHLSQEVPQKPYTFLDERARWVASG